ALLVGVAVMVAWAGVAAASEIKPHSFIGLGFVPGGSDPSEARAVSADGSVVVGSSGSPDGQRAFVWTLSEGMVALPVPTGQLWTWANDVSADGLYVVGDAGSSFGLAAGWEGIRWQVGGDLDRFAVSGEGVWAKGVSADGSVVVGSAGNLAYRWTEAGDREYIGTLYDSMLNHRSYSSAVSDDGDTIVGDSNGDDGYGNSAGSAYLWTREGGMAPLVGAMTAAAISGDGTVVAGTLNYEAYRWTAEEGLVMLGTTGPYTRSLAQGVSGDGRRVLGYVTGEDDPGEAFIWEEGKGMRLVRDILVNDFGFGDELDGWVLTRAWAVSEDGSTIVGRAINPEGKDEAFRAVFPEPATLALMAAGLAVALGRRTPKRARQSR
ncbi:MAG: PEP-CTERM sorting domain-containing protein, partial [Planctomycetes bacterium]|nr:PEP-CTERM sorting domain-containing protein [Planctomycetota bacterium]